LIDKQNDNSDSVRFNKINTQLKNSKSQTIDDLVEELFEDKENQKNLEEKKSIKSIEKKEKQMNIFNNQEKQNYLELECQKGNEINDVEKADNFENLKIRKNNIEKKDENGNKNHIFETDFPNEDEINQDIIYNHNLLIKNDKNSQKLKDFNYQKDPYKKDDYSNNKNFINKNQIKNTLANTNVINEKNEFYNNDFELNKEKLEIHKINLGKNKTNEESLKEKNISDDLHLNIYTKKQLSIKNPSTDIRLDRKLTKNV